MMKKLLAALLSLMLLCTMLPAFAQNAQLTVDEMLALCDSLLSDALTQTPVSAQAHEDGGYVHQFEEYALYSPDSALTANSRITGVELGNADALIADMRGIAPGHTLDALLEAYPLDNESLQGTYSEVVLYMAGLLPSTVNVGRAIRSGSHMLVVEHTVYASEGENVEKCCMVYTLENNVVIAVQLMLDVQDMTLNEAQEELNALSALQEKSEYSVYSSETPEALTREDLSFSGLDFLAVTPESALTLLGNTNSDTWAQDGENFMRSMQWADVQLVFGYDSQKTNSQLILLQVYGEGVEGPRNLHLGDSPDSVMARFERAYNEGALLYGDGETAPYAKFETRDDGSVYILYAAQVEEETVLLVLTFVDNELVDMTCTYL